MRPLVTTPIYVRARRVLLAIAVAVPMRAIYQAPESTVELTAMRAILAPYRLGRVTVDSAFARPDQAPPGMTSRVRPAQRHRSVIDALHSLAMFGGTDTLRVRASDPQIRGETATISVTVDGRVSASTKRHFYETVAFVLRRDGTRWVIRSRTQSGES